MKTVSRSHAISGTCHPSRTGVRSRHGGSFGIRLERATSMAEAKATPDSEPDNLLSSIPLFGRRGRAVARNWHRRNDRRPTRAVAKGGFQR